MSLAVLDAESGSSISKYLKKTFKKYDIEKRKEMTAKECLALIEDLYDHTGLDMPAHWEKKVLDLVQEETLGDVLDIPLFCSVLMASKFWEGMEKKGNLKAKKLMGDDAKAAINAVIEDNDGFLEPSELVDAYLELRDRLHKAWNPDTLKAIAESQIRNRKKPFDSPIQPEEFLSMCIAGPFRHFELKPTWWSKLGKKKTTKDLDATSTTPLSTARSATTDMSDMLDGKSHLQVAAANYSEVCVILVYQDPQLRTRFRRIHLRGHLTSATDCQSMARRLSLTHGDIISTEQLQPLLERLQQHLTTDIADADRTDCTGPPDGLPLPLTGDHADFNSIDEEQLNAIKAKMDLEFEKKRVKPGDPNWQYRIDLDIAPPTKASEWDSGSDD